jgi:hypothetical protein
MRALSIRQPFAELILRGIKTVEYRTRPTRIIGQRFHIYASKKKWSAASSPWPVTGADNIVVPAAPLPAWMIELAEQVGMIDPGALAGLPMGVIVGSAVIAKVEPLPVTSNNEPVTMFQWHLADVERARGKLRKPREHPQPVWFKPF